MQEMASRRFYLRLQIQYVYKYKLLGMKESKHWALQIQLRSRKKQGGDEFGDGQWSPTGIAPAYRRQVASKNPCGATFRSYPGLFVLPMSIGGSPGAGRIGLKDGKLAAKGLSRDQISPRFQELTGVRQIQNFLRPRER